MVLFKSNDVPFATEISVFTFHYGPIQIESEMDMNDNEFIYIPLWSYSNLKYLLVPELHQEFTFHYGPIQIKSYVLLTQFTLQFTFHYGPIQMESQETDNSRKYNIYIPLWSYSNSCSRKIRRCGCLDLHSTMVLFKSNCTFMYIYYNYIFTFHYGPIQIR